MPHKISEELQIISRLDVGATHTFAVPQGRKAHSYRVCICQWCRREREGSAGAKAFRTKATNAGVVVERTA